MQKLSSANPFIELGISILTLLEEAHGEDVADDGSFTGRANQLKEKTS